MPINDQLIEILEGVDRPGDFYASGDLETFPPRLEVKGVGRIALPLLPVQAEQLVAVAEQAPYGRGEETLVDTEVRRTWQISPERVSLGGRHWKDTLNNIVEQSVMGLGVKGEVNAELYKLLVYDEGCFFVPHRDTEKAAGMFATLVIVLPSEYRGGELVVRHQGKTVELDLRRYDPAEVAFAAFYADCVHEVKPVTEGCRLTLIYNLTREPGQGLPRPPDYNEERSRLAVLLREWATALDADTEQEVPEKLVYVLEHAYTPAELNFKALKNADAAAAEVLTPAAMDADCEIHLALASIEESGTAEYAYYSGRRRRRDWDGDGGFEIDEVYDRFERLTEWRQPEGGSVALPELPFRENELCPLTAFEDMEPDDLEFHEATGNEGASFDRIYRRAALVIWPRARRLAILSQAGTEVTQPYLEALCDQWENEGSLTDSAIRRDALILAGHMLRNWPTAYDYWNKIEVPVQGEPATRFLTCLRRLGAVEHIGRFWAMTAHGGLKDSENIPALVEAIAPLSWEQVRDRVEQLVVATLKRSHIETCAALLLALSKAAPDRASDLAGAARTLSEALPGDPARTGEQFSVRRQGQFGEAAVANTLIAFNAIDPSLAAQTLEYFLAWPKHYDLDRTLLPAALRLSEHHADVPVVKQLIEWVKPHLRARIVSLEPPADWRREDAVKCQCPYCAELKAFLVNPTQSTWRFKGAEDKRGHVQQSIKQAKADVDCETDKKGRPYTLVCTKNQASYQSRVARREQDLKALARLGG